MRKIIWIAFYRVRRFSRLFGMKFLKSLFSPFADPQQWMAVGGLFVVSYFAIKAGVPDAVANWTEKLNDYALAIMAALPLWIALSAARAAYGVYSDEKLLGSHDGHRFIPHAPVLVATERFEAGDGDTEQRLFFVRHVEGGAFVHFTIEYMPDVRDRVAACVSCGRPGPHKVLNEGWHGGPGQFIGIRVGQDRSATLSVRMQPATVPVVIRVYCHHSYVGKDEGSPI